MIKMRTVIKYGNDATPNAPPESGDETGQMLVPNQPGVEDHTVREHCLVFSKKKLVCQFVCLANNGEHRTLLVFSVLCS